MEPAALRSLVEAAGDPAPTIPARIFLALRDAIGAGLVAPGTRLPSSRGAAGALGCSRNAVVAAYELLRADGIVDVRQGARPVVVEIGALEADARAPARDGIALSSRGALLARDLRAELYASRGGALRPGEPDEALSPREAFARALRRAARSGLGSAAAYGEYAGVPRLRRALAEHLRRERGLAVTPDMLVITTGAQAALSILATALCEAGDRVLVEDPGYLGARIAFLDAGLEPVPLPVDEAGADISAVSDAATARLAYVTPANQYPLGVRLSLARRHALIAWAREARGVVLEDDYDGEFHWRGQAAGALQPLAPDVVVYLGSAAKSLMPAVRIGWIVAPPELARALAQAVRNRGAAANVHAQFALASLIEDGTWKLHLRRVAKVYEERAALLVSALAEAAGDRLAVHEPSGGLQLAVRLPDAATEERAAAALGDAGFAVARLSGYALCRPAPRFGLQTSFAALEPAQARRFARIVAETLRPT